jgi:hypothetical protein
MASRNLRRFSAARWFLALRLDLASLVTPVDQPGDVRGRTAARLLGRGDRILDRVVEDGGGDRLVVERRSVRMPATSIGWL